MIKKKLISANSPDDLLAYFELYPEWKGSSIECKWSWKHFRWRYEMEITKYEAPAVEVIDVQEAITPNQTSSMNYYYTHPNGSNYKTVIFYNPKTENVHDRGLEWVQSCIERQKLIDNQYVIDQQNLFRA